MLLLEKLAQTVMVHRKGGSDFQITVTTDVPDLDVKAVRGPEGDRYQLTSNCAAGRTIRPDQRFAVHSDERPRILQPHGAGVRPHSALEGSENGRLARPNWNVAIPMDASTGKMAFQASNASVRRTAAPSGEEYQLTVWNAGGLRYALRQRWTRAGPVTSRGRPPRPSRCS